MSRRRESSGRGAQVNERKPGNLDVRVRDGVCAALCLRFRFGALLVHVLGLDDAARGLLAELKADKVVNKLEQGIRDK